MALTELGEILLFPSFILIFYVSLTVFSSVLALAQLLNPNGKESVLQLQTLFKVIDVGVLRPSIHHILFQVKISKALSEFFTRLIIWND